MSITSANFDSSGNSPALPDGTSGGGASATANAPARPAQLSRYESQKRRDWHTFGQYLKNHRPPLALSRCSGAHVLEFLRYLDQFGKTKLHVSGCPFFGQPQPPAPCPCPLRQAWGSLDALIGRLRAAFEENGGQPEANPFGARAVRLYLREVRDMQSKARGISYEKKKRKRPPPQHQQQQPSTVAQVGPSPPPAQHLQVADLNLANGVTYQHSQLLHSHVLIPSGGDGSGGNGSGGGVVMTVSDAHAGGLMPLSVQY